MTTPVEYFAGWVLTQACKAIGGKLRDRFATRVSDAVIDKLPAPVSRALFGPPTKGNKPGTANGADDPVTEPPTDEELVDVLDTDVSADTRAALGEDLEQILGVKLGTDEVPRGTDGWYVSAYAAILWRVAMMAVWEEHPIAIQGALQGQQWVTVCIPRVRTPIEPSKMWWKYPPNESRLLRDPNGHGPVDFYVRHIEDKDAREREIEALNTDFIMDPGRPFKPEVDGPIAELWHRIDGVNRRWVILKPDAGLETALTTRPSALGGGRRTYRTLKGAPPAWREYPDEWHPLLKIENESDAIAALSAGADDFARKSESSAAAVEAALDSTDQR
ncbi:hypothetical protein JF781_20590 [Mycobacterium sp. WUMAC-067]|uniref:hypothetical protein n=1 Tax=unclassified Mycobacterium TaxID=2642494 RepID=UPI001CD96D1E|nr:MULTISPECIES: hypothetical protein [unclassified Mycobacterium]MCA2244761.1 hypothetical protein [Mycobacterium sp. WUMAC-067]MCA2316335.1 hypothetical protein [Mycobacterium sp. WUMAC-025]